MKPRACKECEHWEERPDDPLNWGDCYRYPVPILREPDHHCGEFRRRVDRFMRFMWRLLAFGVIALALSILGVLLGPPATP